MLLAPATPCFLNGPRTRFQTRFLPRLTFCSTTVLSAAGSSRVTDSRRVPTLSLARETPGAFTSWVVGFVVVVVGCCGSGVVVVGCGAGGGSMPTILWIFLVVSVVTNTVPSAAEAI